jgi:outer membrane receptor protein involved in Fe transport
MTISREIGLEMSFLNNRFGFDASYYHTNVDQITCGSIFSDWFSKFINAGDIENKGVECPYLERLLEPKFFLERKC